MVIVYKYSVANKIAWDMKACLVHSPSFSEHEIVIHSISELEDLVMCGKLPNILVSRYLKSAKTANNIIRNLVNGSNKNN